MGNLITSKEDTLFGLPTQPGKDISRDTVQSYTSAPPHFVVDPALLSAFQHDGVLCAVNSSGSSRRQNAGASDCAVPCVQSQHVGCRIRACFSRAETMAVLQCAGSRSVGGGAAATWRQQESGGSSCKQEGAREAPKRVVQQPVVLYLRVWLQD